MDVKTVGGIKAAKSQASAAPKAPYGSSLFFESVKPVKMVVAEMLLLVQFESMRVTSLLDSICIEYPIVYHHINAEHDDESFFSYLKLTFTRNNGNLLVHFAAEFCCDLIEYRLQPCWDILLSQDNNSSAAEIHISKTSHSQNNLGIVFHHISTDDDYAHVAPHLSTLAELTPIWSTKYKNSELTPTIRQILGDYRAVVFAEYLRVIALVNSLDKESLGQQICAALTFLKNKRALVGAGRVINLPSLNKLLQELRRHEGARPGGDVWFPVGAVDKLAQLLEVFYLL